MRLSDIFASTGEPFMYYPGFVSRFDISVNACVLLCFIGWKTSPTDLEGWRATSTAAITKATGLSLKEQANARKQLVAGRLLEETYARLEHQLLFRLGTREIGAAQQLDAPQEPNGSLAPAAAPMLPQEAEQWNLVCGAVCPKVLNMSASRMRYLQARRRDAFWSSNYLKALSQITRSAFLTGSNDRGWRATFDWLVERPDAVAKVLEGKYGRAPAVPAAWTPGAANL